MILGDSLYASAAGELAKTLHGKALVVHVKIPDDMPPTTTSALAAFDRIVGKEKWDVIHFNFGLGDIVHRAPGIKSFRVMSKRAGGIPTVGIDEYEKNLDALVQKLAKTGARLVWSSTLPISSANREFLPAGSEVEYNERAAAVMARRRVPVNDLHAYVGKRLVPLKASPDVFTLPKSVPFHAPMLDAIQPLLALD